MKKFDSIKNGRSTKGGVEDLEASGGRFEQRLNKRVSKKWKCAMVLGGIEAAQGGFARGGLASP